MSDATTESPVTEATVAQAAQSPVADGASLASPGPVVVAHPATPVVPRPVVPTTVLGAPGSVVRPDTSGELEATVAATPNGALIVLRDAADESSLRRLLQTAGKRCHVSVNPRIGPRSLWRTQFSGKQ